MGFHAGLLRAILSIRIVEHGQIESKAANSDLASAARAYIHRAWKSLVVSYSGLRLWAVL